MNATYALLSLSPCALYLSQLFVLLHSAALFGACSSKPNSSHRTLMAAGLLLSLPLSPSLLTSAQYFERNFLARFYILSRFLRFIVLLLLWLLMGSNYASTGGIHSKKLFSKIVKLLKVYSGPDLGRIWHNTRQKCYHYLYTLAGFRLYISPLIVPLLVIQYILYNIVNFFGII